jgi:hypothetical protein
LLASHRMKKGTVKYNEEVEEVHMLQHCCHRHCTAAPPARVSPTPASPASSLSLPGRRRGPLARVPLVSGHGVYVNSTGFSSGTQFAALSASCCSSAVTSISPGSASCLMTTTSLVSRIASPSLKL